MPRLALVVGLIGLAGACAQASEPAPVGAPAAAVPPPAAPAAPAAPPAAPKVPAFLADAPMGVGHCDPSERAVFSCDAGGGKYISLCTDDGLTQLQYRFGKPEFADIRAPAGSLTSDFHYGHTAWAQGEEHSVWFVNEGHTYKVVSAIGSSMGGDANNYQGVKVIKDDKELAFVKCAEFPQADYLMLLDGVLAP